MALPAASLMAVGKSSAEASMWPCCDPVRKGVDMTRRWSVLLLSCVLLMAHTASGADKPLDERAVIQSADTNGDGRIDQVEFHQRMTEAFFFIDTNKDGFLTMDE